jgi:Tol biopolymer transport system component
LVSARLRGGKALLVVVCVLSIGLMAAASAAAAGGGGRIVWTRNAAASPRAQIVSARPDGSHLQALTHPKKHNFDIDAQISPDGSQVVLERDVGESAVQTVLVGADDQNEQTLDLGCVDPCALVAAPTWFGPSDRIAFTPVIGPFDGPNESAHSAVLQTALLNGSDMQRLSEPGIDGTFEDYHAHLSLDGTYVVFTRVRNDPLAVAAFRMDVDGSDVQQLTPWGLGGDLADLSPGTSATEDLVVFETYGMGAPRGKTQNIATVPSNCASLSECRSQIHYLTHLEHGPGARFNPNWSPNGTQIAYTKFRGDRHDCCVGDIYTMQADGSHRKPVSTSPRFEYRPDWGPAPPG